MRILITLSLLTLLLTQSSWSQSADSAGTARSGEGKSEQRFVDENGNGIDDTTELSLKGKKRRMDRFVDKDGDGICDGRESGLGFHQGKGTGSPLSSQGGGVAAGGGKRRIRGGRP
jgi:hypothetical protein